MKEGRVYKRKEIAERCEKCGASKVSREAFPFGEEFGIYCGTTPAGWLIFRLSGQRECILNGGAFEEVKKNIKFIK